MHVVSLYKLRTAFRSTPGFRLRSKGMDGINSFNASLNFFLYQPGTEPLENFTPFSAFSGGIFIGLAATLLLLLNGRIAGISGIMGGLMNFKPRSEWVWRLVFLLGIVIGAFLFHLIRPDFFQPRVGFPLWLLALGGFLVGFGTRMGNGCTSGHAVCGIARLSVRSIVATIVFMTSGFMTVYIIRHLVGL